MTTYPASVSSDIHALFVSFGCGPHTSSAKHPTTSNLVVCLGRFCTLRAMHPPPPSLLSRSLPACVVVKNTAVSHREATMEALLSSPALLWDVSGPRQEQQMPPTFSSRAMRSWLLSSWARYSDPVKVSRIQLGIRSSIFFWGSIVLHLRQRISVVLSRSADVSDVPFCSTIVPQPPTRI